jgi:glycerophosphoryl diester phosphodiesterase
MNTIKINSKNTMMVAHRGVSKLERENTCPAFLSAASRSYFGIETDVHMTKDGKLVLIHDETLTRVTGGACEINVEESNFSDIADIVLPDLDGTTVRRDIRVPLLSEYIAICKKYDKKAVLEIKGSFTEEGIDAIISEVRGMDYINGMIFISFDLENCIMLREKLPDAEIQLLVGGVLGRDEVNELLKKYSLDLDIYFERLTSDWIQELHEMGVKINCWTCDSPEKAEELVEWGVDFITSNILE